MTLCGTPSSAEFSGTHTVTDGVLTDGRHGGHHSPSSTIVRLPALLAVEARVMRVHFAHGVLDAAVGARVAQQVVERVDRAERATRRTPRLRREGDGGTAPLGVQPLGGSGREGAPQVVRPLATEHLRP
jgi:hypothetical protein